MPVVHVKAEHWRNISSRFFFNLIYFSKLCEMHFMVLCSCSMLSKFYVRPVQSIPLPLEEVFSEIWQIINQNMFSSWAYETFFFNLQKANTVLSFAQKVNICRLETSQMCHFWISVSTLVSSIVTERPKLSIWVLFFYQNSVKKILLVRIFRSNTQLI